DETNRIRTSELATVRRKLQRETARRKAAEAKLEKSRERSGQLLAQSLLMQEQLRLLSRRILLVQEEERKQISRELHDEISQILTGINVRLAALKAEAAASAVNLKRKIANTQRLVEKSVEIVHRFARALRPTMLDDLGLIPALLAFTKEFGRSTGIRADFVSVAAEQTAALDSRQRTALYRIAQEALTNVHKHAKADVVTVSVEARAGALHLAVSDNGTAFDVARAFDVKRHKRLGIIGMRERAEMVGATFAIESVPGQGTTIRVQLPLGAGIAAEATPATDGIALPATSQKPAPAAAPASRRRLKPTVGEKP
ncbi:MAG: sensor histidine kinase, partial [Lentisphaeria bacterium]|nr:sensor histidine kinase [Lentisphaeria bacterium]